jgi:hypothetical protein
MVSLSPTVSIATASTRHIVAVAIARSWSRKMARLATVTPQPPSGDAESKVTARDKLPPDALPIDVEDARLAPPGDGFGQLWRKRYRVRLDGVDLSPHEAIHAWKARYGEFWPSGNQFYRPLAGLEPGQVALSDLEMPAGTRLATAVVVEDADATSFRFGTAQGHTFAGEITFSAIDEDGTTIARIEILMRASDPIFELGMILGGHRREDEFWFDTLRNLAAHFGASDTPEVRAERLDRHRQWRHATNIIHNSYIRTGIAVATRPFRRLAGRVTSRGATT